MPKTKITKTAVKKTTAKKRTVKKTEEKEIEIEAEKQIDAILSSRYFEAVGRRKTAIARVRLFSRGDKGILVNDKPYEVYFPSADLQQTVTASLRKMNCIDRFSVSAKTKGGGLNAQAEAIRHGIARALVLFNADFRKRLRKAGHLTRDPRMRERKKFGLKRARRAPQWQKR